MPDSAEATGQEPNFLDGVRVLELADEIGEYCGKVLAGLGAAVVKIEPPDGEATRSIGPFYQDEPHPDRSLFFWHYNHGKRSVVLDLDTSQGVERFRRLVTGVDVLLDTRPRTYLAERGLDYPALRTLNPGLIYTRMSPFGDDGPWADFAGSDLIHLALGGVMMNCGYDYDPEGRYDTPPIAPQMWQAYHVAGEITAFQIMAALTWRLRTGEGQMLSSSVHQAVSTCTETDIPDWVYARDPHMRLTGKHSFPVMRDERGMVSPLALIPGNVRTKDGRWLLPYSIYMGAVDTFGQTLDLLKHYGCEKDLGDPKYLDMEFQRRPDTQFHIFSIVDSFLRRFTYDREIWREAQQRGLAWGPLRRPEENLRDTHWRERGTFAEVDYPELGRTFTQVSAKWVSPTVPWPAAPRAPLLGEHSDEVLGNGTVRAAPAAASVPVTASPVLSSHGKPFALSDVRVIDLAWILASAGAGRFFAAHGAEVIKVEHKSRLDPLRMGVANAPQGGPDERSQATGPIRAPIGMNRSGNFLEVNAGKLSVNLNLKSPRGRELLLDLVRDADLIVEGYSPGTMDRMGLGYDRLREVNPRIIYVQQSGMGQHGSYGRYRTFGPTAQAFSGLSEMSGLPEPYEPAGIGYSYLDWFGAFQMTTAMMAALHRQRATGLGCWIDSSQAELGLYLTGTAILDHEANGRRWQRHGNRSPWKPAAPHGAYRTLGEDRWIAIAAFTEGQWDALTGVLGLQHAREDERFGDLTSRLADQDALDVLVEAATIGRDGYALMAALQAAGVPAGVCQSAEDRCENDPQLRHIGWQVEVSQSEIGVWPVKEVPVQFSATPPFIGGRLNRSGPSYGEDNDYVLRELLKLGDAEIADLVAEGVV